MQARHRSLFTTKISTSPAQINPLLQLLQTILKPHNLPQTSKDNITHIKRHKWQQWHLRPVSVALNQCLHLIKCHSRACSQPKNFYNSWRLNSLHRLQHKVLDGPTALSQFNIDFIVTRSQAIKRTSHWKQTSEPLPSIQTTLKCKGTPSWLRPRLCLRWLVCQRIMPKPRVMKERWRFLRQKWSNSDSRPNDHPDQTSLVSGPLWAKKDQTVWWQQGSSKWLADLRQLALRHRQKGRRGKKAV